MNSYTCMLFSSLFLQNIHTFEIHILLLVPYWIDLLRFMFNPSLRIYIAMTRTNWHYLTSLLGSLFMINKDFNRQFLSWVATIHGTNRNYLSYIEATLLPGEESKEATSHKAEYCSLLYGIFIPCAESLVIFRNNLVVRQKHKDANWCQAFSSSLSSIVTRLFHLSSFYSSNDNSFLLEHLDSSAFSSNILSASSWKSKSTTKCPYLSLSVV